MVRSVLARHMSRLKRASMPSVQGLGGGREGVVEMWGYGGTDRWGCDDRGKN